MKKLLFVNKFMLRLIIMLIMNWFLISNLTLQSQINMSNVGLFILTLLILSGSVTDDLYLFISLIPFYGFVRYDDKNILFIFLIAASIKLFFCNKNNKINILYIFLYFVILLTEFLYDLPNVTFGNFILIISILLYVFVFLTVFGLKDIDYKNILIMFIFTLLFALLAIIYVSGGNFSAYTESQNSWVRFGEEARQLGGAMGVPIYCMMIISCCYIFLFKFKISLVYRILILLIIVFSFFVGILTISRVFIVGLGAFIVLFLFAVFRDKSRSKLFVIFLSLLSLFFVFVCLNVDMILSQIAKFQSRGTLDITTGRASIYEDSITYLLNNPLAFLFGSGALNYVILGKENGFYFSAMAHNLFLDGLMSWGVVGFSLLIYMFNKFRLRIKQYFHSKESIVFSTPLIIYLLMNMTGGTFNYFSTYMYLITLIVVAYSYNKDFNYERNLK